MMVLYVILGLIATTAPALEAIELIQTVYQWKLLEFAYENNTMRTAALKSGDFVPIVSVLMDLDVYYKNSPRSNPTIFATIPRFLNGTPATLGIVTNNKYNGENMIQPYPSWSWHRSPWECKVDRIVSVYKIKIDECGRLWVVDTGSIGKDQTCPPQLLTFDLTTNKLINRIEIPKRIYEPVSSLITPIIDVRDPMCKNTFVYIADNVGNAIVVYDMRNNQIWKATDKTMNPNQNYTTFTVDGQTVKETFGVGGMALEPFNADRPNKDRILYYHAVASVTENKVYTSYLRNQSRFANNSSSSPEVFYTYPGTRSSQCDSMSITKNGITFFGIMSEISINCWNTRKEYGGRNIGTVYQNSETMQVATGVKVVANKKFSEDLWLVTNRFQKFATGTLSPNETNYRISAGVVDKLLQNSVCL